MSSPGYCPFPEDLRALFSVDAAATREGCTQNPTKVDKPFWKFMVAHGRTASRDWFEPTGYQLRPLFNFYRLGRTETRLPDGRIVFIGGEYEDSPSSEFFIYNDVVVVSGHADGYERAMKKGDPRLADLSRQSDWIKGSGKCQGMDRFLVCAASVEGASPDAIEIYGYPTDVFAPTDFHTATYHRDESSGKEYIYIIGGLGYTEGPHRKTTLTHRLDLQDFSIQRMETSGDVPPPLWDAMTRKQGDTILYISGSGPEVYELSLADMRWSRSYW